MFLIVDERFILKAELLLWHMSAEGVAAGQLMLQPMRELVFILAPRPHVCTSQ